MNEQMQRIKTNTTLSSILMVVIGLAMIIFSNPLTLIITYIVGGTLCIWGGISLILYFTDRNITAFSGYGFVTGALLFLLGIIVLIKPQLFTGLLDIIMGTAIIIDGLIKMQYAIDAYRMKYSGWGIVLVMSLLTVILGIVVAVDPITDAGSQMVSSGFMILSGVSLLIAGITDLFATRYIASEWNKKNGGNARATFKDI